MCRAKSNKKGHKIWFLLRLCWCSACVHAFERAALQQYRNVSPSSFHLSPPRSLTLDLCVYVCRCVESVLMRNLKISAICFVLMLLQFLRSFPLLSLFGPSSVRSHFVCLLHSICSRDLWKRIRRWLLLVDRIHKHLHTQTHVHHQTVRASLTCDSKYKFLAYSKQVTQTVIVRALHLPLSHTPSPALLPSHSAHSVVPVGMGSLPENHSILKLLLSVFFTALQIRKFIERRCVYIW